MDEKTEKKSLKGMMRGSLDSLKGIAKDIKVPEIKKPEVKIPPIKGILKKKELQTSVDHKETVLRVTSIPTRNALKIIYYLMTSDDQVHSSETEKFDLIGREITPEYKQLKEKIIAECQTQMNKVIDPDDFYDVVQDGVEDELISSLQSEDTFITPKLLVWDLLTVAYSDGKYDEIERKLIKYIVRKLDIDKAVFLEMESAILTVMDLEREEQWIKTTDRPYLTIEAMVNEIIKRKQVIFDSVKDLIAL